MRGASLVFHGLQGGGATAKPQDGAQMRKLLLLYLLCAACATRAATRAPIDTTQPPTLKLPEVARPTHYSIGLTVDPARETFEGDVTVALELLLPTRTLWLSASDLTIKSATLTVGKDRLEARVLPQPADFVGFALPRKIGPGPA